MKKHNQDMSVILNVFLLTRPFTRFLLSSPVLSPNSCSSSLFHPDSVFKHLPSKQQQQKNKKLVSAPVCTQPIGASRLTTSERVNRNNHRPSASRRQLFGLMRCLNWRRLQVPDQTSTAQRRPVTLLCLCTHR